MFRELKLSALFAAFILLSLLACKDEPAVSENNVYPFFVGTYTQKELHVDGKGEGIYDILIDVDSQKIKVRGVIKDLINPSYLVQVDTSTLLCVNELGPNEKNYPGRISRIELNKNGSYRKAQEAGTYGNAPCHIAYSAVNKKYAVANYLGGQWIYGSINDKGQIDTDLTQITFEGKSSHPRQDASHLHMSLFTADGNTLLVSDLGADKIYVMTMDSSGQQFQGEPKFTLSLPAGTGPRHMAWNKDQNLLYVAGELSNKIIVCRFDKRQGSLEMLESYAATEGVNIENTGADIHLTPDFSHVVVSNRGENNLAFLRITGEKLGQPKFYDCRGKTPRNFIFTRDGKYLMVANQDSGDISVFSHEGNGIINYRFTAPLPSPVCMVEAIR